MGKMTGGSAMLQPSRRISSSRGVKPSYKYYTPSATQLSNPTGLKYCPYCTSGIAIGTPSLGPLLIFVMTEMIRLVEGREQVALPAPNEGSSSAEGCHPQIGDQSLAVLRSKKRDGGDANPIAMRSALRWPKLSSATECAVVVLTSGENAGREVRHHVLRKYYAFP